MTYKEILPPASLSNIVRSFWVVEGNDMMKENLAIRLLPFSCPRLVFHYHNHFHNRIEDQRGSLVPFSVLNGHTSKYQEYLVSGRFGLVGVYLFPFAPQLLFQLRAEDYFSQVLSVESLLPSGEFELLKYEIMSAADDESRINSLIAFLLGKLNHAKNAGEGHLNAMVKKIILFEGNISVAELSQKSGISVRQLDRKFKSLVGITPKLYSRIVRFQSTIDRFVSYRSGNLTAIALEKGYYDQAHFIHEFSHFAGFLPSFLSGKEDTAVADIICDIE
jgi:AraC-like DNA-binding protein